MNSYLKIAIVIVAFVVGFFLGRKTIYVKEKITFVKGETIRDTIVISQPTFVEIPSKPEYIYKYDTITVNNIHYISEVVDTASIIQDYILMRTYEFNLFNSPTLGKFDVKQQIGYNKLLSFDYTFTPVTKQVTQFREPVFTPFVTGGYSTNQSILVGGGLYIKHIGVEYNFNLHRDDSYHTFKLNYKL